MALSTKAVIAISAALVLSMLTIGLSVGLTVGGRKDTIFVSTVTAPLKTISTSTNKSYSSSGPTEKSMSNVTTVATTKVLKNTTGTTPATTKVTTTTTREKKPIIRGAVKIRLIRCSKFTA